MSEKDKKKKTVPDSSSESFSSFISWMHPSCRRLFSIFECSTSWSHRFLRAFASGTWAVHVLLCSRVRKTLPSQNTRSDQWSREPSMMHSRERRTVWFPKGRVSTYTDNYEIRSKLSGFHKIGIILLRNEVWLLLIPSGRRSLADMLLIMLWTSQLGLEREIPLSKTCSATCWAPTTPHCWIWTMMASERTWERDFKKRGKSDISIETSSRLKITKLKNLYFYWSVLANGKSAVFQVFYCDLTNRFHF